MIQIDRDDIWCALPLVIIYASACLAFGHWLGVTVQDLAIGEIVLTGMAILALLVLLPLTFIAIMYLELGEYEVEKEG